MKRIKGIISIMLALIISFNLLGTHIERIEASVYWGLKFDCQMEEVLWQLDCGNTGERSRSDLTIQSIGANGVILEFPTCAYMEENVDSSYIMWGETVPYNLSGHFLNNQNYNRFLTFYRYGYESPGQEAPDLSKVRKIIIHEDYPVFPFDIDYYDPSGKVRQAFSGNTSIKEIEIDTNNMNGMEFCPEIFSGMVGLKKVSINVGTDQTLTLDGSVFEGCTNLETVNLTGQSVNLIGGSNFSGCRKLSSITINGRTNISGEEDFKECTNLKNVTFSGEANFNVTNAFHNMNFSDVTFRFGGKVSNGSGVPVISQCKGIDTISFYGMGNCLAQNFLSDSEVENLNIENGTTTLDESAIYNTHITGMSFNASTKVGNGALAECKVSNMYFNTSDIKANNNNGVIGKNTTVTNLYLNHYDISRNANKVTELDGVPLGKLNCDKIYVFSPNFHCINNTAYPGGKQTEVYGYGGTVASYDKTSYVTGKEMFQNWMGENNGFYENMIELIDEKPAVVNLFVTNSTDKATFDLNTLKITAKYNNKASMLDQLPVDENGNVLKGTFQLQYTHDPDSSTNFNYKILTKVEDSYIQGEQYTYTDEKGNKYITCQEDQLELGVGTHHYYVQAAGETWPLDVVVEQNTVTKLSVSITDKGQKDGKLHVTVGDSPSDVKRYITVEADLANGKTQELQSSQYTVVKTDLSTTPVTVQDTTLVVYHKESRTMAKIEDVQVHEKKITSFDVACDKANMPIGSQLTLDDVTLTNGIYENPLDTPIAKINKDYHFLQDGQETDTYTIKSGENKIPVTYGDCVEVVAVTGVSNQVKDYEICCDVKEVELYQKSSLDISEVILENVVYADERLDGYKVETIKSGFTFVVNGEETDTVNLENGENTIRVRYNGLDKKFTVKAYAQSVDRIEVSYCGPAVYEGNEVPKDTSVLLVTVYYKHPYEASVLLSNFEVSYDTYHIVPGENNEIYVTYKGVKSSKPIQVLGLADGLKEIKKVEYRGSKKSGTSLEKDNFYVELGYMSGKTVTSEENPAILDSLTFSSDKLTDGENCIKVVYDGALTGEVNVVATAEGISVSNAPEESKSPQTSTGSGIASGDTAAPMATVVPSGVLEVPVVIQTPMGTDSPLVMPTVSPLAQPQKGNSFTVQGVNYKVTGVTKQGGSVSVTGYDKKVSKVKMQTAVSLDGYQYTVTKIEKGAFKNCSKLSGTISLTKNVKVVGDRAFYGCKNIKKVVFGSNVTQIGKSSFYNCSKLSNIQFKTGSVKKIGKNAFKGISKKYTVKTTKALKKTYAKRLKSAM